jgi:endonuclease/exonuclease/phosphatase family metal-dependent hydrolase
VPPRTTADPRTLARSPLSFRIATYNALGEGHTGPYHDADRFAPSRVRTEWVVRTMVNAGLDVIGMQETSSQQVSQILRAAGPGRLASFPDPAKDKVFPETTIFWNPQRFALVRTGTVSSMFIRKPLPRPYVELRDRRTGRAFWVMAIHNAGWDRPGQRREAMLTQLAKIDDLRATGLPVFYVGDFNEKQPAVCRVLKHGGLASPTGGHLSPTGTCVPPLHMRIDWLFGPATTQWSGYQYSRQPMVRLTTDHGVAMASVQVP